MFTLLLPEQVAKFWNVIKYAIEQSLPPTVGDHPDKMNRILSATLSGKILVWASYSNRKFRGIVLTKTVYDDASDTKNLLVYCMYGYAGFSKDSWIEGLRSLTKYAESKGFSRIIAYTDVDDIVSIVNRLGGETRYRLISFDVNEIVQKLNKLKDNLFKN